jgi:hypothetical protein
MSRPTTHRPIAAHHNPTWEITPADRTPQLGAMLRVGARAIPLNYVRGFIGSADGETDKKPAFAILAVFGIAALFFLLGVLDVGWRTRFLVAAVLFACIAISALHDLAWQTTSGIFRVEILTASGETIRYATVRQGEQQALLAALEQSMVRPKAANDDGQRPGLPATLQPGRFGATATPTA